MKANKILFLGNSISLHPAYQGWGSDTDPWGMAATTKSQDYIHVLAGKIDGATGGSLAIAASSPFPSAWSPANGLPVYSGNVLNIADIFERNFNSWDNARIQTQLDAKPDIVVLQFGENLANGTLTELKTGLDVLMAGLINSSNPQIFITSNILGHNLNDNTDLDQVKKAVVAEDPAHRVFVDMGGIAIGSFGHPSDAGMTTIANTLYAAMETQAAAIPEPSTMTLLSIAGSCLGFFAWRRRIRMRAA